MGKKRKKPLILPDFENEDEEFEFWETHDFEDYAISVTDEELGKLMSQNPITHKAFLEKRIRNGNPKKSYGKAVRSDHKR